MTTQPVQKNPTALVRLHTTERSRRMERFERFAATTQYVGRPSFFNDSVELFKRAPHVVYPIVACAIDSHVGMTLGKCPVVTSAPDEDDAQDEDDDFGLDEEDSKTVDRLIAKIGKQARLHDAAKKLLRRAMCSGSAVAILAVRNARLTITAELARWCMPTFDQENPRVVTKLEIKYPYLKNERGPKGEERKRAMLYRRVIDETRDVTYLPVEAPQSLTEEPQWREDPKRRKDHGLGFCPVVWYAYMPEPGSIEDFDGKPLHDKVLDEVEVLDRALSQRDRAVLYQGDPVTAEFGVTKGYNPSETVPFSVWAVGKGEYDGMEDPEANRDWRMPMAHTGPAGGMGRKRGPGQVWQYEGKPGEADVRLLTMPAGALEAMNGNMADIEVKIAKALRWDQIDPKEMASGATLSGRALEMLYRKQLAYDDDVRADFGDNCLLPLVDMLLRIVLKVASNKERWFYLPGAEAALPILGRFERDQRDDAGTVRKTWVNPHLSLKWQPYFEPNEADRKATAETVTLLMEKGLLKRETAIGAIAHFYGIENSAQYAEDMEAAEKEKAEAAAEQQKAMAEHAASLKPQPGPLGQSVQPAAVAPPKPPKPSAKAPPAAAPKPPRGPREAKPTPFKKRPQPEA